MSLPYSTDARRWEGNCPALCQGEVADVNNDSKDKQDRICPHPVVFSIPQAAEAEDQESDT